MRKCKLAIPVLLVSLALTGCTLTNDVVEKEIPSYTGDREESFVKLNKGNKNTYDNSEIDLLEVEELKEVIKDVEVVDGMAYDEYVYNMSDIQSDNINKEELDTLDFEYDLSEIKEAEIRDTIKAVYKSENASNMYIAEYTEVEEHGQVSYILCVIKVDDYYHMITYKDGVATSIKDNYHLYEEGE